MDLPKHKFRPAEDISLPINARAEIIIPFGTGDNKLIVGNRYGRYLLNDGEALKRSGLEVFRKVFKEVEMKGQIDSPHFILKVKSKSSVNTSWATYKAKVDTELYFGNGNKIGERRGQGTPGSHLKQGTPGSHLKY